VFNKGCFLPGSLKTQKKVGLEREFENLLFLRGLGFDRTPLRVARPLGERRALDFGLFQEWEGGHHLDHYFRRAIFLHEEEPLFSRLELLASFLARLHQITATFQSVDWHPTEAYYYKVLYQLLEEKLLSNERIERFGRFITLWMKRLGESSTAQVLVHGDATPTNFLFPSGGEMVALDLERLKTGDPVWDLGMVCGEIKHAYLWLRRDKGGSEPFIRHFLLEYARHFDDPDHHFAEITRRNPFFMAVTELRIARNGYLDRPYRELLINEAENCLKEGYWKTD
jgi:thiamine kinase-like enzyme